VIAMLTLVIANKAYSSWSQRPWLLMKQMGIPFEEIVIPMGHPETREQMLKHAPTGKCPSLKDGETIVWDSLAIVEYLAESFPDAPIWPRDKAARAMARSLSAEMHSGYQNLRQQFPANYRRNVRRIRPTEETQLDIDRIEAAWREARRRFGAGGPFLFGAFSAADAMFAPVVNRLHVYDAPVAADTRAYMDAMMALPAWRQWEADAEAEPWAMLKYDSL
jgi:glutathione S-transferase